MLSDYVMVDSTEPIAMLEEALPGIPATYTALRARTLCAISVHLWYDGEPERRRMLAEKALALARDAGDRETTITALLARRHALYGPTNLGERIRVASQALREAERCRNQSQRCLILTWRAVDLLEAGDMHAAQRDVDTFERIAAAERLSRFRGFPARWRALRATIGGRFAEAEQHIADGAARMRNSDDPNAEAYSGLQLAALRLEQGRSGELEQLLRVAEPWLAPLSRARQSGARGARRRRVWRAVATAPRAACSRRPPPTSWAELARDPEMIGTVGWLAEACARLGDRVRAAQLYERLRPWISHQSSIYAIACRGSLARYLGLLARTAGRSTKRSICFEQALVANRAIDAELYAAWTLWDHAETLALRDAPGRRAARGRARARGQRDRGAARPRTPAQRHQGIAAGLAGAGIGNSRAPDARQAGRSAMRRPARHLLSLLLLPLAFGGGELRLALQPHAGRRGDARPGDHVSSASTASAARPPTRAQLRAMPEPDRSEVLDLVFGDLAPSVVRIKPRPAMEPVNDDADPAHVNAAGFVRPDDHLWQLAEIFARGNAPMLIGALWTPPAWMKNTGPGVLRRHAARRHGRRARRVLLGLSVVSRGGRPSARLAVDPERARGGVAVGREHLHAAAHGERARGGRAAHRRRRSRDAAARPRQRDRELRAALPAGAARASRRRRRSSTPSASISTAAPAYPDSSTVAPDIDPVANAAPESMPLWMTEFSNTTFEGYGSFDEGIWQAELIHESLVAGVSMYVMWNLYRPGGPGEAAIVIPTTPGAHGYTVTPKYWTLRQYAKYVRPGAVRIEASSDDPDLLVTAFRDDAAGKLDRGRDQSRRRTRAGPSSTARSSSARRRWCARRRLENGVEVPLDSADRFARSLAAAAARARSRR